MTEPPMDDRILTVEEVAIFLQLSEATIYKMAQDGKIPAKRVGRSWRFSHAQIQEWFRDQDVSINE
ncbi:MAG: helix-turn-helix domain-containing protein [Anaerolineales bacterium]|nr:helix-turn-helix domain-containing protein [Anaerolineales bacterium]